MSRERIPGKVFIMPKPSRERPIEDLSDNLKEVLNSLGALSTKMNEWFESYKRREIKREDFEEIYISLKEIRRRLLESPEMIEWRLLHIKPAAYLIRTYAITGVVCNRASIRLLYLYTQSLIGIIPRIGIKASSDHSTFMQTLDKLILKYIQNLFN